MAALGFIKRFKGKGITVEAQSRLDEKTRVLKEGMTVIVYKVVTDGQVKAMRSAPFDLGFLRGDIRTVFLTTGDLLYGEIVTNIEYAVYQEYGTRFHGPHPFMAPALRQMERQLKSVLPILSRQVQNA